MSQDKATATLNRILYVEDDPDIQLVTKLTLELRGRFVVATCNSGAEALAKAPRFKPDLVLLDVMMPYLDGPGTLLALRTMPVMTGVPVIFMTGKVQPEEIQYYRQMGAAGVIAKPFDPLTLIDDLRRFYQSQTQPH